MKTDGFRRTLQKLAKNVTEPIDRTGAQPTSVTQRRVGRACGTWEVAKDVAYLNGALQAANADDKPEDDEVARAPAGYAKTAGKTARVQIAKAGERMAEELAVILR